MSRLLSITHPDIAAEWHPSKNLTITPDTVTFGSPYVAWWLGKDCSHEWDAKVCTRTGQKQGCPICKNKRLLIGFNDFATVYPQVALEWHPTKNGDLTPSNLLHGANDSIWWLGKECGHEWESCLRNRAKSQAGCVYCSGQKTLTGFNDIATTHPELAAMWHPTKNDTDMSPNTVISGSKYIACWICPQGHEWESKIAWQAKKKVYCTICTGRKVVPGINDMFTRFPFLKDEWHPTKNSHLSPTTLNPQTHIRAWWVCSKGHEWDTPIRSRISKQGSGCPSCAAKRFISKAEQEIADFLIGYGLNIKQSDRQVLRGSEIDIYIPDKKIGIEYNGVHWHSEKNGKDRKYHHDKWLAAKNAGVQLIQIWEDEWNKNPEQINAMLAHKLGVTQQKKVFARKTVVVKLGKTEIEAFLNKNHIQGYASGSAYFGLRTKDADELVSAIILKKESGNRLNIIRYATSANVVGGFTKLLKYAEQTLLPASFVTFSDHCISDGGLYEKNGFIADKELTPDYRYVVRAERKHKFGYRLKRFKNDPELLWEEGLTERELAALNDIPRIWDAGKTRWVKVVNS